MTEYYDIRQEGHKEAWDTTPKATPEDWDKALQIAQDRARTQGRNYVIRPNGAVHPCIYWDQDPIGFYPADDLARIAAGSPLSRIREGLRSGAPVGTCAGCGERRTALYRLRGAPAPEPAPSGRLPTHPG